MNTLPFLALGIIASGYMVATERLDQHFDALPAPAITAYPASLSQDLSVRDLLASDLPELAVQPVDQPHCGEHGLLAQTLSEDFDESAVERRVAADGLMIELWASELMGTWTVLHRGDDGMSCIVSSGTGWNADTPPDQVFSSVALAS